MNPNLTTYYMAEQTNRQGLSARAERGWQAELADVKRPRAGGVTVLRSVTGTLLIRLGRHLGGFDPALTIASATENTARA